MGFLQIISILAEKKVQANLLASPLSFSAIFPNHADRNKGADMWWSRFPHYFKGDH